jgi:hypothetical protein
MIKIYNKKEKNFLEVFESFKEEVLDVEKIFELIDTLVEEMGVEKAREEFIQDSMEDLDNFARDKKFDDIFHLTADEVFHQDDEDKIDNIIDFIKYYKSDVKRTTLAELFKILLEGLEKKSDCLPVEILGEFFDNTNRRFTLVNLTLKEFLEKCDVEELKIYQNTLDIVIRNLTVDKEENCLFDEDEQRYILRVWIGEGDYLYFKFTEEEINIKMDRIEKSEYYLADNNFRDYNYIFKIRDFELHFQISDRN